MTRCKHCGQTFERHAEHADPRRRPRMPCGGLRAYFAPKYFAPIESTATRESTRTDDDAYSFALGVASSLADSCATDSSVPDCASSSDYSGGGDFGGGGASGEW